MQIKTRLFSKRRARSFEMPKKSDARSFRFELVPNTSATPEQQQQQRRRKNNNNKKSSKGGDIHVHDPNAAAPPEHPSSDDPWDGVCVETICSLVPQMDASAVLAHVERARQSGMTIDECCDALFHQAHISPQPQPAPSMASSSSCLVAPAEGSSKPITMLARLPDELLRMLFVHFDAGYVVLGTLGRVCKDCYELVKRWLATEVRTLRFINSVQRTWSDTRILSLVRAASAGLEVLHIHSPPPDKVSSGSSAGEAELLSRAGLPVRGFASVRRLLAMPLAARLKALHLHQNSAFDEDCAAELASTCRQLRTLALVACCRLTDRSVLELLRLPRLEELYVGRNPQLSARALNLVAAHAPCLTKLDATSGGEGVFDAEPAPTSRRRRPITAAAQQNPAQATTHHDGMPDLSGAPAEVDVDELLSSSAITAPAGWDHVTMLQLTDLNLSGWRSLRSLSLDGAHAPKLRVLNVARCERLVEVAVSRLPHLASLAASQCKALRSVRLDGCPQLSKLNLELCRALDTLRAPLSTELSSLSLFGCRALGSGFVEPLLKVSGHSMRSLNLNGALGTESLTESAIRHACPSIEHLDVLGRARKW
jgi:hypothetical protein